MRTGCFHCLQQIQKRKFVHNKLNSVKKLITLTDVLVGYQYNNLVPGVLQHLLFCVHGSLWLVKCVVLGFGYSPKTFFRNVDTCAYLSLKRK
jgi:hypothetical protein